MIPYLIDGSYISHWSRNKTGTGVSDGFTSAGTYSGVAKSDRVHFKLPVSLFADWKVGEVASVIFPVGSSENDFAAVLGGGVSEKKIEFIKFAELRTYWWSLC